MDRNKSLRIFTSTASALAAILLSTLVSTGALACVSLSVATVQSGGSETSVSWQVSWDKKTSDQRVCEKKAEAALEEILQYDEEVYDELHSQPGGKSHGHTLTGGFWVVTTSARIENGAEKRSYGLGASAKSIQDAEKKSLLNLAKYDPEWSKSKHKYKVEDKGKF